MHVAGIEGSSSSPQATWAHLATSPGVVELTLPERLLHYSISFRSFACPPIVRGLRSFNTSCL
jgi:hypothetical protein